jgi:ABC-type nitrate/sulfonate/bicarbonate transport system permease component
VRFPAPSRIAQSLVTLAVTGFPVGTTLWDHTAITLLRIFSGFGLAVALAVPLGLVIGASPFLDRLTAPTVAFCRSVATLSLLPLAVAWFGTGEASKIFMIGYGCFWVMISNVIAAIKQVDPILVRAARTMDTSRPGVFLGWCCRRPCRGSPPGRAWRSGSASW